jgi:hypothetical protein
LYLFPRRLNLDLKDLGTREIAWQQVLVLRDVTRTDLIGYREIASVEASSMIWRKSAMLSGISGLPRLF